MTAHAVQTRFSWRPSARVPFIFPVSHWFSNIKAIISLFNIHCHRLSIWTLLRPHFIKDFWLNSERFTLIKTRFITSEDVTCYVAYRIAEFLVLCPTLPHWRGVLPIPPNAEASSGPNAYSQSYFDNNYFVIMSALSSTSKSYVTDSTLYTRPATRQIVACQTGRRL